MQFPLRVPTIFLAYSQKAYGMAEYIYGSNEWVIPLKNANSEVLIKKIEKIINNTNSIKMDPANYKRGFLKTPKI